MWRSSSSSLEEGGIQERTFSRPPLCIMEIIRVEKKKKKKKKD